MENEEKMPLFTRLNDAIDGKIDAFTQYVAKAAEDKEGISDDIVRGGLRTLGFVANLPVIKQIGQLEEGLVSQVGKLAEKQDLIDPRSFTYSTRIGTAFIPYFGAAKVASKAVKARKVSQLAKGKNVLGQPLKTQKPIAGGLQEQFSPNLKATMMENIDNPKNLFDEFGPEGPRGSATDDQIMQAYREVTGELQLNPNRVQETPKQLSLFEDGVERLDPTPNPNLPEYVTDAFRAATAEVTPRSGNPNLPGYMAAVGDSLIFRYKQFRNSIDGIRGADGRKFLELFQTPMSRMFAGQTTGDAKTFNTAKRAYQAKMRAAYDPVMDAMGLNLDKPFQFQMHHIAALKGVMGIFDGVGYDSQLHRAITDQLLTKLNGIGNMKENLMGVMGAVTDKDTTHYLAHLFLNDRIGKAGELFFTDDVLAKMAASDNFRLQKASELGDILLESELVARQADNVINTLYAQGKAIDPDVLFKNMEKLNDQGYLKGSLIDNKYQVQALPKLIENIIDLQDADAILNIDLVRIIGKGGQELKTLQKLFKYVEEGKTPPAKVINRIKNDGQQDLFRTTDQKLSDAMATWAEIYRRRTETLRKTLTRKNQELYFQDPDVTKPPT